MDHRRNSPSPDTGFGRYGPYNVPELPTDSPLPFPPLFPGQGPQYAPPAVPIFERRLASIRRSSQSSHNEPFLRPRVPQDQSNYEMAYQQEDQFPEEEPSPEPLLATDPMVNASDFVKKLFKALEDPTFHSIMCWGPFGDRFMIKDVEECTKTVLPRLYKHSNFASFVRQLNKYDFHKVKNFEDNERGDQSWCFRHANFHASRPEDLENVKRKPAIHQRTGSQSATSSGSFPSTSNSNSNSNSNDSPSSPARTYNVNLSPYPQSSKSSSNNPSGSYGHKVGEIRLRSPSPTRVELYSEIQSLKRETEDSKVKLRSLDRTSESMRTKMEDVQKLLDDQGGILRLLASQYLDPSKKTRGAGE